MSGFKRCAGSTKNNTQCAKYMKDVKYSIERNGIIYALCNTHRDSTKLADNPVEYDDDLKLKSPKNGKYRCNSTTKNMSRCKNTYNEENEYCSLHKKKNDPCAVNEQEKRIVVLERKLKQLDCKNTEEMRSILEEVYEYFKEKDEIKGSNEIHEIHENEIHENEINENEINENEITEIEFEDDIVSATLT